MTVPASWKDRAAAHEAAQRKLRSGLREKFPFAAKCGDELRAAGFKDARVIHAVENGQEYGEALTGLVSSTEVLNALKDNRERQAVSRRASSHVQVVAGVNRKSVA